MAVQAGSAAGARPIRARVNNFIAKVSRRRLLAVQREAIIRVHSGLELKGYFLERKVVEVPGELNGAL